LGRNLLNRKEENLIEDNGKYKVKSNIQYLAAQRSKTILNRKWEYGIAREG